jgi:hypothetical protein
MDEFRCAVCKGTFPKAWSDEEAMSEAEAAFTPEEMAEVDLVCEDCWEAMKADMPDFAARYGRNTP